MSGFNKKYFIVGLLSVLAIIVIVFQLNKTKEKVYQLDQARIDKLEIMRESLIGKKFAKLSDIISDKNQSSDMVKIIAYYQTNDCPSCVNKLMNAISDIEFTHAAILVYVVSDNLDNMNYLVKHNIKAPFFTDGNGEFQKWINYSYSPVLLYLDKNNIIKEVYHATTPIYKEGRKRFFKFLSAAEH